VKCSVHADGGDIAMNYVQNDGDGGGRESRCNIKVGIDSSSMTPSSVYCRETLGVVEYENGRT
jgi:hypothetical protein